MIMLSAVSRFMVKLYLGHIYYHFHPSSSSAGITGSYIADDSSPRKDIAEIAPRHKYHDHVQLRDERLCHGRVPHAQVHVICLYLCSRGSVSFMLVCVEVTTWRIMGWI